MLITQAEAKQSVQIITLLLQKNLTDRMIMQNAKLRTELE